jgi:type IV pilus assembly protein PilC
VVKGKLAAKSEEAATELLMYSGYQVISLKQMTSLINFEGLTSRLTRVQPTEIILFCRQLALLLESGINISSAIELLREQASSHALRQVLSNVITDLRSGSQLSAALAKHPEIFSPIHCQSLSLGEKTGGLEVMLKQVADHIEKEIAATKSIKSALTYPVIAAIVAFIVVGVLIAFVFPAFGSLYESLGAELPAITRMTISLAEQLQRYGLYLLVSILGLGGAIYLYIRTPYGKYKFDALVLKLPVIGRLAHLNELTRCCRSISLLFRAGLPLTEIMPLVVQSSGNKVIGKALFDVQQDMLKGEGLSQPMSKSPLFLPMMVQMVKVGEETGKLDTTLAAVAQSYEADARDRTRALIALIQPAMTLLIAIVVGFIALSLVSAMYSIYGQVL